MAQMLCTVSHTVILLLQRKCFSRNIKKDKMLKIACSKALSQYFGIDSVGEFGKPFSLDAYFSPRAAPFQSILIKTMNN